MDRFKSRRNFLKSSGLALGVVASQSLLSKDALASEQSQSIAYQLPTPAGSPAETAIDENYWNQIRSFYSVTDKITNLENGYWGIMATPVLKTYETHTTFVNFNNTYYARRQWAEHYMDLNRQVAEFLNVGTDEVVLTRGATESLQALITGYNLLKPGDKVLYADLDYSEMKHAMRWLEERRGVEVIKIDFPEPANWNTVLETYQQAFDRHPDIKMMLMTHLNNWTGLISPVQEVAKMARERGIDVILDAAHSVGQVDFSINELGCDFVGVNLHKWVGAPIGCGVMVIKKDRIKDIDSYLLKAPDSDSILNRIDTGTANFAAYMTIPKAIEFHSQIGTAVKQARLKYLRDLWVQEVRELPNVQILTPDADNMVAALTSFRLNGQTSTTANNAIVRNLAEQHGVLTVRRTGPALGDCVRVTPSVYNNPDDVMKFANSLKIMAGQTRAT